MDQHEIREAENKVREKVTREYPSATEFLPEKGKDGEVAGFTFRYGRRYGWVTLAGMYARGLETYRSTAAELIPEAVKLEQRGDRW